ncbi:MAG: right-handed parallel beta-helix repeat-containing protein [Clostridia bacterium]|nr:right-handed parallel beta-helix repeat-containing protein [Clostridia bacterium]
MSDKVKEKFFNVLDFGAEGDGVTDDTEACRRALAVVDNGGTVYFPKGTYLISDQLFISADNVTVRGDGNATKLLYTRVQDDSPMENQSLIGLKPGIRGVTVKDLHMEYQGEFYGEEGQSYSGRICGIYFLEAHRVLVENVEIDRFNHTAVYVSGNSSAYATDVTVRDCYLHHNRVGGILYGFVDGIIIENNVMEYHGSEKDGGTGYGSAGFSGAIPLNVRVINNEANYNYRKGIDLHAGENAVIEGNTCRGNRLYGIYVEGPCTNHVIIKNNIVSDSSDAESRSDVSVIGNTLKAASTRDSGICTDGVRKLTVSRNRLFLDSISGKAFVSLKSGAGINYISSDNMMITSSDGIEAMVIDIQTENTTIMSLGDMLNGKALYRE